MTKEQLEYKEDLVVDVPNVPEKLSIRHNRDNYYVRYKTKRNSKIVPRATKNLVIGKLLEEDHTKMHPNERYFELFLPDTSSADTIRTLRSLWDEIDELYNNIHLKVEHINTIARKGVTALEEEKEILRCKKILGESSAKLATCQEWLELIECNLNAKSDVEEWWRNGEWPENN